MPRFDRTRGLNPSGFQSRNADCRPLRGEFAPSASFWKQLLQVEPDAEGEPSSRPGQPDPETHYRRLFEIASDGILILDASTGVIKDANPSVSALLEYSREELCGQSLWDLCRPEEAEICRRVFQDLQSERPACAGDLLLISKGGLPVSVEIVSDVYWVDGEKFVRFDIKDRNHRKIADRSEERARQAQKMETVGQLAGGLAHDFSNLLGVILGYCEVLQDQSTLHESARQMVQEIQNAGTCAKSLTQRLLAFSRRQVLQPVVLDLNKTAKRTETMLRRLIGENIVLESVLNAAPGTIKADTSQIELMLMNLAINARDAMPEGGRISIETTDIVIDTTYARQNPLTKPGPYVMLTVSDTGIGMDAETQSHIFEPFFSTKPLGQGTGLGLSTVFGIVKQSGGAIGVYSEPGKGTTFKIYFPRCDEEPVTLRRRKSKPARGGSETILLVDDAAPLRALMKRLLEDAGYTVIESGDPAEAFGMAKALAGPLPLMITDMVMPKFSGALLTEKVAAIRPETRVLYASGYNGDSIVLGGVIGSRCGFLEKPFTREDLLMKVRDLLDAGV